MSVNLSVPGLHRFSADTLRHAVTLTFNPFTLIVLAYRLKRDQTVPNLCEIEQSTAAL